MHHIIRASRKNGEVLKQNKSGDLEYLTFPALEQTGIVKQYFSTRLGGVSEGIFASMNLSFSRGDAAEHVEENYRRVARVLGITLEDMVASKQTHTTNIRLVTKEDKGKGIVRPLDYEDIDGLITKEPGVALVTTYADCVPLYFVDPVNKAIGLAHSGWRGTVQQMGACMVREMQAQFGSRPEDMLAAIGPSICQECYEVSEEVAEEFRQMTAGSEELVQELFDKGIYGVGAQCPKIIERGKALAKYQLDLWLANVIVLRRAGIPAEQISITDVCTCHNPEYLFSHRASKGQRGALNAFLMLKG